MKKYPLILYIGMGIYTKNWTRYILKRVSSSGMQFVDRASSSVIVVSYFINPYPANVENMVSS